MHLHWSEESTSGICPECGTETVLLVAHEHWQPADVTPRAEEFSDGVNLNLEVTCHWCPECDKVRSVAVNG